MDQIYLELDRQKRRALNGHEIPKWTKNCNQKYQNKPKPDQKTLTSKAEASKMDLKQTKKDVFRPELDQNLTSKFIIRKAGASK